MSRIGKKPVPVPAGVTANLEGQTLSVKGPKGTLSMTMLDELVRAELLHPVEERPVLRVRADGVLEALGGHG